jgi:radical SAM protein with 4Fe4S-binding SPASM domain
MKMLPCSFDQQYRWAFDINNSTIEEAWNSSIFEDFRDKLRKSCPECTLKPWCLGGCPINKEIVLCGAINGGDSVETENRICN